MRHNSFIKFYILLLAGFLFTISCKEKKDPFNGWSSVNGNPTGNKYSSLKQIDTLNVTQLRQAWTYQTGDADTAAHSQIQCNPIVVKGVLYGTSPQLKLFALDAATGKELWSYKPFDSVPGEKKMYFNLNNNRGVAYWTDGAGDEKIFYTAGPFLRAVNAKTGELVETFGDKGKVDLREGLGVNGEDFFVTATSAPTVYKDLLIAGTRVSEGMDAAPGHIRAYNVRTGKQVWIFHTIPQSGEPGHETWEDKDAWKLTGGANNWMGMIVDQQTGIAYIPIGSASMDFYGGKRRGSNLYADCLLALDANSGKHLWHFQYIHHDTWDWDPSSAPVLLTVTHNGNLIDAVAQTTKTGFVFLFNRSNGAPLFPIIETPVDSITELTGEKIWPTQPIPQKPLPFVRQHFTEKDINPYLSPEEYAEVKKRLAGYHTGLFKPESKEGTVILPGFDGGAEWGGPAVDPTDATLFVNANEMAWLQIMIEVDNTAKNNETYAVAGQRLYTQNCSSCHGADRKGGSNYPPILDVNKKLNKDQFIQFISTGRRMMPAFAFLKAEDKDAIASFILNIKSDKKKIYRRELTEGEKFRQLPYTITGYNKFISKSGLPALAPPWGTLTAIDLNSGDVKWKTPLGDNDSAFIGKPQTGVENYGGPVITAGGLLFIAATKDGKFRAFNKYTGKLLWETQLPNAGFATPAIYEIHGKQFVVIACGGGKLKTTSGDSYVAFALP